MYAVWRTIIISSIKARKWYAQNQGNGGSQKNLGITCYDWCIWWINCSLEGC